MSAAAAIVLCIIRLSRRSSRKPLTPHSTTAHESWIMAKKPSIADWTLGGTAAVILASLALWWGVSIFIPDDGETYDANNSYESISQCEPSIERLLKSPSTAKFDTATGDQTWTATCTVDSQNSFGATARSRLQCAVVNNSNQAATTTIVDYLR